MSIKCLCVLFVIENLKIGWPAVFLTHGHICEYIFLFLIYFFIEGLFLYRLLLFSVKPQHESARGIYISLPSEPPSHHPPNPVPLG